MNLDFTEIDHEEKQLEFDEVAFQQAELVENQQQYRELNADFIEVVRGFKSSTFEENQEEQFVSAADARKESTKAFDEQNLDKKA